MFSDCPPDPDTLADEYILCRLSEEHAAEFEEHMLSCPACFEIVQQTGDVINLLKGMLGQRRSRVGPTRVKPGLSKVTVETGN